jgi:putative SOS response-associated peptidase YedK
MKGLLINARSESAPDQGTFKAAVRNRCCAIPATCYDEWRRDAKDKPLAKFAFRRSDGGLLLMAGLWEEGDGAAGGEPRFLILTRAMEASAAIHDRTPVMLSDPAAEVWLDPGAGGAEVFDAARHMGDHDLVPREVVFSAAAEKRDSGELLTPLHAPWPWQA